MNINLFGQKLKSDTPAIFNFAQLKQHRASIVVFFDIECPICQKYTTLLKEIDQEYRSEGINVYVVYPHKKIDLSELKAFKSEYQFTLPIYFDTKRELLHLLKGSVTPEAFLLDGAGKIVYHGAIDNWFYSLGKSRTQATETYLIDAIEAMSKGEVIRSTYQEPIGCAL